MQQVRLHSPTHEFYVDMRIGRVGGKWLASADTPDGPTIGYGEFWFQAALGALSPFDDAIEELMRSFRWPKMPHEATQRPTRPAGSPDLP